MSTLPECKVCGDVLGHGPVVCNVCADNAGVAAYRILHTIDARGMPVRMENGTEAVSVVIPSIDIRALRKHAERLCLVLQYRAKT